MNYIKCYDAIIQRGKLRGSDKSELNYYTESHHIIPSCIGGSDDPSNKVLLTAREHFIAHWLLSKIHPNSEGLIYAYWAFYNLGEDALGRNLKLTSRGYKDVREKFSEIHSNRMKDIWESQEYRDKRSATMSLPEIKAKMSDSQIEAQNRPEVKAKISTAIKEAFKRDDVKERHSRAVKKALDNPETKKRQSEASKARQRTGKHWEDYDMLYELWIKLNRPKRGAFGTHISKMGYPKSNYQRLILQFIEDYERKVNNENDC
ncbi:homing endonuclease [Escherichia phage a20]|nr:homing endonuclease [Escherichia phage a20]